MAGGIAFDSDLVTQVLGHLVGAPTLHTGDVDLGKSASGHAGHDRSRARYHLRLLQHRRLRLGSAEHLVRGGPTGHPAGPMVQFRGDGIEVVLGELPRSAFLYLLMSIIPLLGRVSAARQRSPPHR